MSSNRFTGFGNSPVLTLRQRVADENGTIAGINCDWRMYPEAGNLPKFVLLLFMHLAPVKRDETIWYFLICRARMLRIVNY